ncbi:MAG TPA: DUF4157 domain-containing protein [Pyrinomonadaceae bacterium]
MRTRPETPSPHERPGVHPGLLQRKCACGAATGRCARCDEQKLSVRRKADGSQSRPTVPASVHETLRSPGRGLDAGTRSFMESRFGHDFSRVRVHADAQASESAADVSARAYTVGRDVVFARGQYAPQSGAGRRLLAHELAHTIQQTGGAGVGLPAGGLEVGPAADSYEREADAAADAALSQTGHTGASPLARAAAPAARLQRQPDDKAKPGGDASKTATVVASPLAGAKQVKWRFNYKTQKEAQDVLDRVRALRVKADDVVAEGKLFTFHYYPLSKEEAQAAAVSMQKQVGDKHTAAAKEDKFARSWYVTVTPKCPEAIPPRPGYRIWKTCFPGEAAAKAQVSKFTAVKVTAEVYKVDDKQFGVYYKALSEAEAKAAGEAEASKRVGHKEGMYKVTAGERKDLDTFTYTTKTQCPPDYDNLGTFTVTSYVLANEREFSDKVMVKDPCGLKGEFRERFLNETEKAPYGVTMEGSGKSLDGRYIHYNSGKKCFEVVGCAQTATSGVCATAGRTAAVNFKFIPKGTAIFIEDIGERVGEDTGGDFKGSARKIDIYQGEDMSGAEANRLTYGDKLVCKKKKKP